jgi:YbbR domain-containing protein
MRPALRWITSNSPVIVLSLILAVLAWIVSVEEADPTLERRFPQGIPIELSNLPDGMIILGTFDERVEVVVRAPTSVWNSLGMEDFDATIDLAGLGAGVHELPVQLTLNKNPARVVQFEPQSVTLSLESEIEQVVPVRVQIQGEPTLGYLNRTPVVNPSQVTVSGPSSYVSRVVEASVRVSVEGATADVLGEYQLQPLDVDGDPVPYVILDIERVDVRVPVELSVFYRPLVVKVTLEGQIAFGHRITEIAVDPPSVTASGLPSLIAGLPGFIETEPISVEGASEDVVERPALSIPSGVSIVMEEQPVVTVSIEAIQSSLTSVITPEIRGLQPGFTVTVSPETVEVILSGPLPLLEVLEEDDVRIVLDVFGLPAEVHQIEPQIVVPKGVTAQSVNPATVQVRIGIAPTVTPTEEPETG